MSIYNDYIIDIFKKYSSYFSETSDHFIIRCPYCGDSTKRKKYGHLYISKNQPVFRCNRCNFGSSVKRLIYDLSGYNNEIKDIVNETYDIKNNYYDEQKDKYFSYKNKFFEFENVIESMQNNICLHKLNYLKERIGDSFLFDNKISDNIVINIIDLFEKNELLYRNIVSKFKKERSENLLKFLHNNFIGFVCYKKNLIIFRNIDKNSSFRYFKMKLYPKLEDFFIIDNMQHIYKDIPKVIMGEGVFDVLLPYILRNDDSKSKYFNSDLYIASGKSYSEGLKFLAIQKCVTKFDVCILSDSDINLKDYDFVYKKIKKLSNKVEIILNLRDKDFGVFNSEPTISKIF